MSQSPVFKIWVGVDITDTDFDFEKEIQSKIPEIFDEDGDLIFDDEEIKRTCNGLEFKIIKSSGEKCGFGVVIFRHDWNDGVVQFDPHGKVRYTGIQVLNQMDDFFKERGITAWFGRFCSSDIT